MTSEKTVTLVSDSEKQGELRSQHSHSDEMPPPWLRKHDEWMPHGPEQSDVSLVLRHISARLVMLERRAPKCRY